MAVYGGSISQLAANEQALQMQKRAQMERTLQTLIQSMEAGRGRALQSRGLDQRDAAAAQQQQQFEQSMAANAAQEGRLTRQFDTNLEFQKDRIRAGDRERRMNLMLNRRGDSAAGVDRETRVLLPYMKQAADRGDVDAITELSKTRPFLAAFAPAFLAQANQVRTEVEQQFAAEQADAELINQGPAQVSALQHMAKTEQDTSWNPANNGLFWDTPDRAAIAEWETEAARIPAARAAIMGDRNRMAGLVADSSGRYSAVPPPWRTSGGQTTTTSAPAPRPATSQFKPGTMVIQGGVTYQFDGQNWIPQR